MNSLLQLRQQIRFSLSILGESNAHHEFERLCMDLARRRIVSNLVPATGPVSSGGDQGRDGESHWTNLPNEVPGTSAFVALASTEKVVLACTIQKDGISTKIRRDLASICGRGSAVQRVVYFTIASVTVSKRHELEEEARSTYDVDLDVWDAVAISHHLSDPDLFFLAVDYLEVPSSSGISRTEAGELSVAVPDNLVEHRIRGRDELLAELNEQVNATGGRLVLCGAGGCGKSTVALALARHVAARRTVWWVNAATWSAFVEGLLEVAVQAGVSRVEAREVWRNRESAKDQLWHVLDNMPADSWMLIVDNADDSAMVYDWIREPKTGNTVVVTSRDQRPSSWWKEAVIHPIGTINDVDGAGVLIELAPDAGTLDQAQQLARRLGGLPLALLLVGRYLAMTSTDPVLPESRTPRSFDEYRAALDGEFSDTISSLAPSPNDRLLGRTWEMSLDLLAANGISMARPLFRLVSFFATDPLPVVLLRPSLLKTGGMFAGLTTSDLEAAVRGLLTFGLLHRSSSGGDRSTNETMTIHPFVREITRIQPDTVEQAPAYSTLCVVSLYMVASEFDPEDTATWPVWRLLLPHCTFTAENTTYAAGDEYLIRGKLAYRAARYAHTAGKWSIAEEQYVHALRFFAKRVSPDHHDVTATRHCLASLKRDLGRLDEAEADFLDILRTVRHTLSQEHEHTLATRHELARLHFQRGDVEAAHEELSVLVPCMTRTLGPEHQVTLAARHELARTLCNRGELTRARRDFEALIAIMTRTVGATSPLTLAARHELAYLDLALRHDDTEAASNAFEDILALETRTQGSEHPSTLTTQHGLGEALMNQGRLDEAETEFREILARWTRAGLQDHAQALVTRTALAELLAAKGELTEAEGEHRSVLAATEATLGPLHPDAIDARLKFVHTLRLLAKHAEAEGELRSLLAALLSAVGADDPTTLTVRQQLADLYFLQAQDTAAETELRLISEAETRTLGADHPATLVTRSEAAAVVLRQGRLTDAVRELTGLVYQLDSAVGHDDDRALAAHLNLAHAHQLLHETTAARAQLLHVVAVCRESDRDHEEILGATQAMLRQLR